MSFRRAGLLLVIALIVVSPVAAQKQPPTQLRVTAASFDAGTEYLSVHGVNFGSDQGVVTLNGFPLPVVHWSDTEIGAMLSNATPAGSYLLTVSRGPATTQFDAFSVTIGGGVAATGAKGDKGDKGDQGDAGPQGERGEMGPAGPAGPTGPAGPKGDKGDTGDVGPAGAQGAKGDTGDVGPQGAPGLPGILGLAGKSCPNGEVVQGFDAQGELNCVSLGAAPTVRSTVAVCGVSLYDALDFVPPGSGLTLANTCTPTDDTQALLISRYLGAVDTAALQQYLDNGGIVITSFMTSHDVYNQAFGTSVPMPDFADRLGNELNNVNPLMQLTPADPFWSANGPFTPETNTGVGLNLSGLPGITPLGSHVATPGTVTLAYIQKGAGRLWLVESNWYDSDVFGVFSDASRQLMRYMVMNK